MIRTYLVAVVAVAGLATAWAGSPSTRKPATGPWTKPVHGIQCRLHMTRPTFDVDELLPAAKIYDKTEVILSIKNVSSDQILVKTTTFGVRLLVHQDGKRIPPLFEQDWPKEDRAWDPRGVANHHWIEPGKEIAFPVLFVGHDSNFGTPLARYWLKPGRYEAKAIFHTRIRGPRHNDPEKPLQIETNTIGITVTGTNKPLPRWTRRRPDVSEAIPEATKKLSQELLQLPPRQAAERYVKEYDKAMDDFGSITSASTCKSAWSNQDYHKVTHVKGVGFLSVSGQNAQAAKPVIWQDYGRKITMYEYDGATAHGINVMFDGHGVVFNYDNFSPITLAFPMRRFFARADARWEAWREGDVLLISTGWYQQLVGIDLPSLAVLFNENWGWVYHYEKQHFVEGFPFPVPRRCVHESYPSRRAEEPDRWYVSRLKTTLHKDRPKDFALPPIPMPNTPGYIYYLPRADSYQPCYRLKISRKKDGVLVGQLFDGDKMLGGKVGDVRTNPLGNFVYHQSPARSGWFMEMKKGGPRLFGE
jgi:hypothetical protein